MGWESKYICRQYIADEDSILAAGISDHNNYSIEHSDLLKFCNHTQETSLPFRVDLHNTTTVTWTRLPNMNEPRLGHALVMFKGLICAVGGSFVSPSSAECFNFSTNQWTLLPPMNRGRRNAAAVELNDELYVIRGETMHNDKNIRIVRFETLSP